MGLAAELDRRALVTALERDRARFVAFLRRRVGDEAEDLYQQSLLRAVERAGELRDPAEPAPWFWRVLRNAVARTANLFVEQSACRRTARPVHSRRSGPCVERAVRAGRAVGLLISEPPRRSAPCATCSK
jgi:predicted RNA polymerase sigma factor